MVTLATVLIEPVISEKAVQAEGSLKYTFRVHLDANKTEIKAAVESFYGLKPLDVKVITLPEKHRRGAKGAIVRKRRVTKKAIVTMKEKIDFNAFK